MKRNSIAKAGRKTVWDDTKRHHLQKYPRWIDADGKSRPGTQHYLFDTWSCMRRRCLDPNFPDYQGWGARGIRVCDRWLDFRNYVDDVESLPHRPDTSGLTSLDRSDNESHYEFANMRFADARTQARNRRAPYEEDGIVWQPCELCSYNCLTAPGICEYGEMEISATMEMLGEMRMERLLRPSFAPVADMPHLVEWTHTGNEFDCLACAVVDPFPVDDVNVHLMIADNSKDWCRDGATRGPVRLPRRRTWREEMFATDSK